MPNWCSNFLVVSGGTQENLRLIAEKFSDPSNDRVFESLIGKNPKFDEEDWYNHNCATYGTKWDIRGDEYNIDPIDESGGFSVRFDTAWSAPIPFVTELSRMYGVNVRLEYEESGNDFAGYVEVSAGEVTDEFDDTYHYGKYTTDSDAYLETEGDFLVESAIDDNLTEQEFIDRSLYFMSEADKENILQQFKEAKNN